MVVVVVEDADVVVVLLTLVAGTGRSSRRSDYVTYFGWKVVVRSTGFGRAVSCCQREFTQDRTIFGTCSDAVNVAAYLSFRSCDPFEGAWVLLCL